MDLLSMLFRDGGPVMGPIALVSLAAWWGAFRTWGRIRNLRRRFRSADPEDPGLAGEAARAARVVRTRGSRAALLPLLGLLGTVTGMLGTFDVLRAHGTGEPRLLAGGIREALITTEAGLAAAIPLLVMRTALAARLASVEGRRELRRHRERAVRGPA